MQELTSYRIYHVTRLLFPGIRTRMLLVLRKTRRSEYEGSRPGASLSCDGGLVASAHVPLDTTSHQSIPTLGRRGPIDGAHYFPFSYIAKLTIDQHQEQTGYSTLGFSIAFPTWLLWFFGRVHTTKPIDLGDSM